MNLQMRLELNGAVQQWVNSFMKQYNISASMMEDALSKVLLNLKDLALQEYLTELQTKVAETQQQEEVEEQPVNE